MFFSLCVSRCNLLPARLALCRKFTPLLSVVYEDQTTPEGGKKRVEVRLAAVILSTAMLVQCVELMQVVFVSSDSDDSEFDEYYGEMPWSAVKYDFVSTLDCALTLQS